MLQRANDADDLLGLLYFALVAAVLGLQSPTA